jgi:hypothetical protein
MILFSLVCDNGHDFESWFASNDSFDFQIENDLVSCPHCNVLKIGKAVMAPAVARGGRKKGLAQGSAQGSSEDAGSDAVKNVPKQDVALIGESGAELRRMAQELHAKIIAATVDVGSEFPTEARKIHDGDAPERAIRGQASLEEARALVEEGVSILPMPILPNERS